MKKLFNLMFALPLLLFAACSNDDVPNITISMDTAGSWKVEGDSRIYVVEGDTLLIEGITVKSLDGKNAGITQAAYFLNNLPYAEPFMAPFMTLIPSDYLIEGNNTLAATMTVAVVDYPIQSALAEWTVTLVSSKDQLPEGAVYTPLPEVDIPEGSVTVE